MNTAGNSPRTIVESETFKKCREKYCSDCRKFDEITRGLMWSIARSPHAFAPIGDKNLRIIKNKKLGDGKVYRFFFREIDPTRVELLYFEPVPED